MRRLFDRNLDRGTFDAYLDGSISLAQVIATRQAGEHTVEYNRRYGVYADEAIVELAREFPKVSSDRLRAAVDEARAAMMNAVPDTASLLADARAALKRKRIGVSVDTEDDEPLPPIGGGRKRRRK